MQSSHFAVGLYNFFGLQNRKHNNNNENRCNVQEHRQHIVEYRFHLEKWNAHKIQSEAMISRLEPSFSTR